MRPLFALLVAAVVVIGTAPIGAAAIASPADLGTGPGLSQTTDNGTEASTSNTTESDTPESNTTATPDGSETAESDANNSTATAIKPGAQLAGVVAVQRTEVVSEVGSRAFGQRVAAAASNGSKAEIVASEVNDSQERLAELQERLAALEAAREAGNISEGRYRAETAQAAAEINAIERRLEQSTEAAASLPADIREANGISTSSIERLRTEARNLSGPEVAAIARSIGGDRSGRGLGDNVGPPGRRGEASGPASSPDNTGDGDAVPPANRGGNASDRGNDRGGDGATAQESEANRADRETGRSGGPESDSDRSGGPESDSDRSGGPESDPDRSGGPESDPDDAAGPGSSPETGNGNANGNGPDGTLPNDGSDTTHSST